SWCLRESHLPSSNGSAEGRRAIDYRLKRGHSLDVPSSRWFDELFSHGGTEARRIRIQISVDDAGDPVAHQGFPEVQQVAQLETGQSKVSQHLFLVSGRPSFYGLQFHDHPVSDNQVGSESFVEPLPLIFNGDAYLALDPQATPLQCSGQGYFIDRLQQARTA